MGVEGSVVGGSVHRSNNFNEFVTLLMGHQEYDYSLVVTME